MAIPEGSSAGSSDNPADGSSAAPSADSPPGSSPGSSTASTPGLRPPTPMKIAFALRESGSEIPFAEAVVEVDPGSHPDLLDQVLDSGFAAATGEPPPTSAEVHVRSGRFTSLRMVGERQVWEMDPPAPVATAWTDAAAHHGAAILSIVSPGTWPTDLALPPAELAAQFAQRLEQARQSGHMLHGTARVIPDGR
jgi:hypothetical protein